LNAVCLQLKVKKHAVIAAILFIWIAMPAFFIIYANLSTDVVKDTCVPWGVYSSYTAQKILISFNIIIVYLLPLTCMLACYSRIVYMIRNKVTSVYGDCSYIR